MATIAAVWNRLFDRERAESGSPAVENGARVRSFANEDIYFYVKRIDNTRVRRESDPTAGQACWKMIGSVVAAAVVLVFILMPSAYGLLAGYQIEALRQEGQRLAADRAELEVEETALLSPARMQELAKMQQFIDPAPSAMVYLDASGDSEFAKK